MIWLGIINVVMIIKNIVVWFGNWINIKLKVLSILSVNFIIVSIDVMISELCRNV